MKWMIASDIHGSAKWCERLMEAWRREAPARLILLGDLLYHGPRNDLPEEYAPKRVIEMLNAIAPQLLCVRGNCEAEVDQMVLKFPVMADYAVLAAEDRLIYLTHGHVHGEHNPPPLMKGDILLCGHTHIPCLNRRLDAYVFQLPHRFPLVLQAEGLVAADADQRGFAPLQPQGSGEHPGGMGPFLADKSLPPRAAVAVDEARSLLPHHLAAVGA